MEFLKILWDNLKKGPVTDAFPFGETYTPVSYTHLTLPTT